MGSPHAPILQRLERSSVSRDGHRLWKGAINNRDKNGIIKYQGRSYNVARVAAHLFLGLDLDDPKQEVCHRDEICRFRNCWEPKHLYVGTHEDNVQDVAALKIGKRNASTSF